MRQGRLLAARNSYSSVQVFVLSMLLLWSGQCVVIADDSDPNEMHTYNPFAAETTEDYNRSPLMSYYRRKYPKQMSTSPDPIIQDGKATPEQIAQNISRILDNLVNPRYYDKRLRPSYGGEPVNVGITIYVSSISAVSEVAMDYTLDFYLRQKWTDKRLAFKSYVNELTIDVNYQKLIWVPDTFFPNEKSSYFHHTTTHNSFLRIDKDGNVRTSQRITVTANCPMHLQLFPLDSQECTLEIESYGYSTHDIEYNWDTGAAKRVFSVSENVSLPQFRVSHIFVGKVVEKLSTGEYSRLKGRFVFTRQLGFYVIQIYLPANLIVIISWVSFWLSREASPARVALGVTTVLTMTTLMTTNNAAMPKVSYVKTVDIYLGTCFFMVFASLLEYACVVYLNKIVKRRKERIQQRENREEQAARMNAPPIGQRLHIPGMPTDHSDTFVPRYLGPPPMIAHCIECDCEFGLGPQFTALPKPPPKKRVRGLTSSAIDKYSRMIFPLIFLCFNAIYWGVNIHLREKTLEDQNQAKEGTDLRVV